MQPQGDYPYGDVDRPALVDALADIAVTGVRWENWARTFTCAPRAVFVPTTLHHCRLALELARRDHRVLRPVGIGHSPSDVACTNDYMLNMTRMNAVLEVNAAQNYIVAQAGITLTDLHAALAPHNLAMRNLGSISDQTLAGIVATATHGSGVAFGVMSTHVRFLTLLTPANTVLTCSPTENRDLFEATVCGLGATGLILSIALEVEPAFRLRDVHTVRPFDEVVRDLDTLKGSGEHTRFWWFPAVGIVRCMVASRTTEPINPARSWFWNSVVGFHAVQFLLLLTRFARPLPRPTPSAFSSTSSGPSPKLPSYSLLARLQPSTWLSHLLLWATYISAYTKHLISRPLALLTRPAHIWAARLACWLAGPGGVCVDESVGVFNIECRYPQHTTEWALPAARAAPCLRALHEWLEDEGRKEGGERPHFPIEIRFSAGDDMWLSPSEGGETCWIGIVQYKPYNLPTRYRALFASFESILAAHGGRPHWAKAHHLDARATRALYPQFERFLEVVRAVDPAGTFRNEYVERHLMGGAGDGREFKARRLPRGEASEASGLASDGTAEEKETEEESEGEEERERERQPLPWWMRLVPSLLVPKPPPSWRTDWRIAPPEEELRRVAARRARVGRGDGGRQDRGEAEGEGQRPEESESEDSDSDATLAGSVGSILASDTSPETKTKTAPALPDADTKAQKYALTDAQKHPARTPQK
ncbi:D-arabinono-1,4-lactone oxidase-domain-containing protein [Mycena polygramma]|nr:D-arabinono-1,4-lactone oxidase-domain-containing protein [Mycena polygramma]